MSTKKKKTTRKTATKRVTGRVPRKSAAKRTTKKVSRKPATRKSTRGTQYQPILDKMAKLKPDSKPIIVSPPAGVEIEVFQNRLNAAFARFPVTPPKGYRFTKQTTSSGKAKIFLVRAG